MTQQLAFDNGDINYKSKDGDTPFTVSLKKGTKISVIMLESGKVKKDPSSKNPGLCVSSETSENMCDLIGNSGLVYPITMIRVFRY